MLIWFTVASHVYTYLHIVWKLSDFGTIHLQYRTVKDTVGTVPRMYQVMRNTS